MHWNIGKSGDQRTITKFAWVPRICENGHKHWLEIVTINQFWGPYSSSWVDVDAEFNVNISLMFKCCNCNLPK